MVTSEILRRIVKRSAERIVHDTLKEAGVELHQEHVEVVRLLAAAVYKELKELESWDTSGVATVTPGCEIKLDPYLMAENPPLVYERLDGALFSIIEPGVRFGANVKIGPYTHVKRGSVIGDGATLYGCVIEGATIGARTQVWRNAHIMKGTVIGNDCLIGHSCFIADGVRVGNRVRMMLNAGIGRVTTIGNDVYIGPNVVLANSNPEDTELKDVFVGDGAWIGTNAVTTPGVSIERYAVVGAGSVVTKSVPAHTTVVGNPAKEIRR